MAEEARNKGLPVWAGGTPERDPLPLGTQKLVENGVPLFSSSADFWRMWQAENSISVKTAVSSPVQKEKRGTNFSRLPVSEETAEDEDSRFLQSVLSESGRKLYAVLENEVLSIGELSKKAGLPVSKGLAAATELELLSLARSFSGGRYAKVRKKTI